MISTPGCSARAVATCSGRKRWCTEQWPFQSSNVEPLTSRSSRPPSSARGFHTRMSASPYPIVKPVLRPRCWSGKKSTLSPLANAHSRIARAFDDVHTAPPLRPTKAFNAADEFMYVIGTTRSIAVTAPIASQASSTSSMSAMSAMEQPALRSGRITRWWSAVSTSADSAMKCTPQNTMSVACVIVRRELGELERVADRIGPDDHLVALVVMAEDEKPVAEGRLGRRDPIDELVGGREGVVVRQRSLKSQHVGASPLRGSAPQWPAGDSPVASTAGLSASRSLVSAPDTGPACHKGNTRRRQYCSHGDCSDSGELFAPSWLPGAALVIVFQSGLPIAIAAQGRHLEVGQFSTQSDSGPAGSGPLPRRRVRRTATSTWSTRRPRSALQSARPASLRRVPPAPARARSAVPGPDRVLAVPGLGQARRMVVPRAVHPDAVRRLHRLRSRGRRTRRQCRCAAALVRRRHPFAGAVGFR